MSWYLKPSVSLSFRYLLITFLLQANLASAQSSNPSIYASASVLDLTAVDPDLKGFQHGFSDGTYGYIIPYQIAKNNWAAKVVRFPLADFNSFEVLDLNHLSPNIGYSGGFCTGDYGYILPRTGVGIVVRFALADFSTITVLDMKQIQNSYRSVYGGFTDGTFGYLMPYGKGPTKGRLLRFSLADFNTVEALDLRSSDPNLLGFCGGFADGTYGYAIPHLVSDDAWHGNIVRFVLSDFATFSVLNLAIADARLTGFQHGFTDGTYGYLAPRATQFLVPRFALNDFSSSSVEVLDFSITNEWLISFNGAFMDRTYGYFVPTGSGRVPRFSLADFSTVTMLNTVEMDPALRGYTGGFTDGTWGYLAPFAYSGTRWGKVVRFAVSQATTCHGNGQQSACQFPFTYGGMRYDSCTTKDRGQLWCQTDASQTWGNCDCQACWQSGNGNCVSGYYVLGEPLTDVNTDWVVTVDDCKYAMLTDPACNGNTILYKSNGKKCLCETSSCNGPQCMGCGDVDQSAYEAWTWQCSAATTLPETTAAPTAQTTAATAAQTTVAPTAQTTATTVAQTTVAATTTTSLAVIETSASAPDTTSSASLPEACCDTFIVAGVPEKSGVSSKNGRYTKTPGLSHDGHPVYTRSEGDSYPMYCGHWGSPSSWRISNDYTTQSAGVKSSGGNACPENSEWTYWESSESIFKAGATVQCEAGETSITTTLEATTGTTTITPFMPGDCAVVAANSDNPDDFGILLLREMSVGQKLFVTDNGVKDDGSFRTGEGILSFTAAQSVQAGTVLDLEDFSVKESRSIALATSGDQVIVYVGSGDSPQFICALNFKGSAGEWQLTAGSTTESALPTGLLNGLNAIALPHSDNMAYIGPTTGTADELRSMINNLSNWQRHNSARQSIPGPFIVNMVHVATTAYIATTTAIAATTATGLPDWCQDISTAEYCQEKVYKCDKNNPSAEEVKRKCQRTCEICDVTTTTTPAFTTTTPQMQAYPQMIQIHGATGPNQGQVNGVYEFRGAHNGRPFWQKSQGYVGESQKWLLWISAISPGWYVTNDEGKSSGKPGGWALSQSDVGLPTLATAWAVFYNSNWESQSLIVQEVHENPTTTTLLANEAFYWVEDGCTTESGAVPIDHIGGFERASAAIAGVRCCSDNTCFTPLACPASLTFAEAEAWCTATQDRLCTKDELLAQKCCGKGLNCDSHPIWTSTLQVAGLTTGVATTAKATTQMTTNEHQAADGSTTTSSMLPFEVDFSMIIKVLRAEQFLNEPGLYAILRQCISAMADVDVSWIYDVTASLKSRRMASATTMLRARNLQQSGQANGLAGDVSVAWSTRFPQGTGIEEVSQVLKDFEEQDGSKAAAIINDVLQSRTLPYEVQVVFKDYKIPQGSGLEGQLNQDGKGYSLERGDDGGGKSSAVVQLVIISVVVVLLLCLLLLAKIIWRKWHKADAFMMKTRNNEMRDNFEQMAGPLASCGLLDMMHPPEVISKQNGDEVRQFSQAMLRYEPHDVPVFVTYALGKRPEDADGCGPGMYFAASVLKMLFDSDVKCICDLMLPAGSPHSILTGLLGSRFASVKVLLVLQTRALYDSQEALTEIFTAQTSDVEIIPLRFENDLPPSSDEWPQIARDDINGVMMLAAVQARFGKCTAIPQAPYTIVDEPCVLDDLLVDLKVRVGRRKSSTKSSEGDNNSGPTGPLSALASLVGAKQQFIPLARRESSDALMRTESTDALMRTRSTDFYSSEGSNITPARKTRKNASGSSNERTPTGNSSSQAKLSSGSFTPTTSVVSEGAFKSKASTNTSATTATEVSFHLQLSNETEQAAKEAIGHSASEPAKKVNSRKFSKLSNESRRVSTKKKSVRVPRNRAAAKEDGSASHSQEPRMSRTSTAHGVEKTGSRSPKRRTAASGKREALARTQTTLTL